MREDPRQGMQRKYMYKNFEKQGRHRRRPACRVPSTNVCACAAPTSTERERSSSNGATVAQNRTADGSPHRSGPSPNSAEQYHTDGSPRRFGQPMARGFYLPSPTLTPKKDIICHVLFHAFRFGLRRKIEGTPVGKPTNCLTTRGHVAVYTRYMADRISLAKGPPPRRCFLRAMPCQPARLWLACKGWSRETIF